MLVLSRKMGERILLGSDIRITVVRVSGGGVRLGIEAPPDVPIVREEVLSAQMPSDLGGEPALGTPVVPAATQRMS